MNYKICLLAGDGIGPEVIASAKDVLSALPLQWDFVESDIGFGEYQRSGSPLPDSTLQAIRHADATLFGAVTTPPNIPNYFSPVVRMRQSLDLFANLRPCRSIPHESSKANIDLIIVRENTEGLYSGVERVEDDGNKAITERVITRAGSERIIRKAFDIATQTKRKSVHVVHKANVLRQTCGLFRAVALEVAKEYPEIKMIEMLVDTCAMELIRAPEQFEVIVTTNLFGDILSDKACKFVGGLGVAASGNIGANAADRQARCLPRLRGRGLRSIWNQGALLNTATSAAPHRAPGPGPVDSEAGVELLESPTAAPAAADDKAARKHAEMNKLSKRLHRQVGQAIADFNMIGEGDKVTMCLSGGKDSHALLDLLLSLRDRAPVHFDVVAVNLDQKQPGFPAHVLPDYLKSRGIPFHIENQDTYSIVKRLVPEGKTMCSLCSRLRRGVLYRVASELGATRIALGHHGKTASF